MFISTKFDTILMLLFGSPVRFGIAAADHSPVTSIVPLESDRF